MKLLLDENISYRVVALLAEAFPGSEQVRRLGLLGKTDRLIWDYARQHEFVIVTHDDDFVELSTLLRCPAESSVAAGRQPAHRRPGRVTAAASGYHRSRASPRHRYVLPDAVRGVAVVGV